MRSHLLTGKVRHKRSGPKSYELEHDVFYFALDLAEIGRVAKALRLFSRDRLNVLTFRDADHWLPPALLARSKQLLKKPPLLFLNQHNHYSYVVRASSLISLIH